ncbi:MAG: HNH endonuclease [Alphaproteobacteria bacterium]|nr:HNH endonuclease [Alphaproteobacteria bacterium]
MTLPSGGAPSHARPAAETLRRLEPFGSALPTSLHDPATFLHCLKRARPNPATGCLEWTRDRNPSGYGLAYHEGRTWLAHRLCYTAIHGTIPDGLIICHHCDNRACIAPQHLFLGTKKQNFDDMCRKGRSPWKPPILDEHKAAEIKARLLAGESSARLARDYGVSASCIHDIRYKKSWKHVAPLARPANDNRPPQDPKAETAE